MSLTARHTTRSLSLVVALAAAIGVAGLLRAQPAPSASTSPPPFPTLSSPVDQFRALLVLSPAERESHLTNRPPAIRQRILAKLHEYDAMNPNDRELRLRTTQLRWYMLSLMEVPHAARATQLATVPEADRQFVKDHLAQWDLVPEDEQKEILKYEKVIENLVAVGFTNATTTPNLATAVPSNQSGLKNLDAFLNLSSEQRQQMYDSFQKFFELSDAEKQKMIGVLPLAERMQMNIALQKFAHLPKVRREQCLNSFGKFSSMSESERQEFLKNAERWRELSPAERQAWRNLVNRLPQRPPLPPGLALPPPLPPPMPPVSHPPLQVNIPAPTNATQ